jgi:hypothetical protein
MRNVKCGTPKWDAACRTLPRAQRRDDCLSRDRAIGLSFVVEETESPTSLGDQHGSGDLNRRKAPRRSVALVN